MQETKIANEEFPRSGAGDGPVLVPPPEGGSGPDLPEIVIRPSRGWLALDLAELWHYRGLLLSLILRDLSVRYKQTVVGVAWAVLQPALTMAILAVFLGGVAKAPSGGIPYTLFVFCGLLPWLLFSSGLTNASNSVISSEGLITKVYFPRLLLPIAGVAGALVDFGVSFGLLLGFVVLAGYRPGWEFAIVPLAVLLTILAAVGAGSILAALIVSFRDFKVLVPFFVQLGLFGTPSIYLDLDAEAITNTPGVLAWVAYLNPMTAVVATFRAGMLGGPIPWTPFTVAAVLIIVTFVVGCWSFKKVEDGFADVI